MWFAIGGWVVSLVASAVFFVVFQAVTGIPGEGEDLGDIPLWAVAVLQVPLWIGLFGGAWLGSRARGTGSLVRDYGLRFRAVDVPVGLALGVATQLAILVLVPIYEALGVDPDDVGESARELTDRAEGVGVAVLLLIVVVGAPVFEEIFYRGLVLRSVERRAGAGWALAVSSLFFGLVHFQLLELPALVAFGLVAGILAQRTGRLGPAIWAHVAFNGMAVASLLATS